MDKHLFAGLSHAKKYADLRPKVPPIVANVIVDFMKESTQVTLEHLICRLILPNDYSNVNENFFFSPNP